jgi:CheY-like chemotaxis protein
MLERSGAHVTIVENGQLAIDALCHEQSAANGLLLPPPFDLVILDMHMPVLDGYGAARRLRELGCELPIVALTAHAMAGAEAACLAAGCTAYLQKPIDRRALNEAIAQHLEKTSTQA